MEVVSLLADPPAWPGILYRPASLFICAIPIQQVEAVYPTANLKTAHQPNGHHTDARSDKISRQTGNQ